MTVAMPDLTSATTRVVTIDVAELGETAPATGYVDFTLSWDLRVPGSKQLIKGGQTKRVELRDGRGQIALPVAGPTVVDDAGDAWVVLVQKSWAPYAYAIRVPAGTGSIALADIAPVQEVTPEIARWALTNVALTVREGSAAGSAALANGVLQLDLQVPRGLPGPGAVATDDAVKALVTAPSSTSTALLGLYQRGVNPAAWGVIGDGVADDTAAWNRLVSGVPAGSVVRADGVYRLTGTVSVPKAMTIDGGTWRATDTGTCLDVKASDVTIKNASIVADASASTNTTQLLIRAAGTSTAMLDRVRIENVTSTGGLYSAVWLEWCQDFTITGCSLSDMQYAGIMVLSGKGGSITRNRVVNPKMGGTFTNAYGIAVSDSTNNVAGRSESIVIDGNYVDGAQSWEGIDTHSGINLRITNNFVVNARTGIAVVPGNASRVVAPEKIVVTGNQIIRGAGDDDKAGIQMIGVLDGPLVTGVVEGNSVYGYTRDLTVAYHNYQHLMIGPNATDAASRLSPRAAQWREWNALTNVAVASGAGTTAVALPAGWFTVAPIIQLTVQSAVGASCVAYAMDVTTTGFTVGLKDPTGGASGTVLVAIRATQANTKNAGGTAGS